MATAAIPVGNIDSYMALRATTQVAIVPPRSLPCPFCESTRLVIVTNDDNFYNVLCSCGAEGPTRHSKPGAIESWNRAKR